MLHLVALVYPEYLDHLELSEYPVFKVSLELMDQLVQLVLLDTLDLLVIQDLLVKNTVKFFLNSKMVLT